jgi:hypothetical protein
MLIPCGESIAMIDHDKITVASVEPAGINNRAAIGGE